MIWIAPSEKDTATETLGKRLWDTADQFRANSGLKAQEYSGPILGIIFLRFAEVRFTAQRAKLEKASASARRGSRVDEPAAYHAEGILYLAPNARFDYLLNLPEAADIGAKVNDAMRDIEKHNPQLADVLPKTYNLFTSTLLKELLKKVSEIPASLDYDAFGRIYEYFLGEFAMSEGQGGGEFYTPSSIVRLLTEVIEPYHGRILETLRLANSMCVNRGMSRLKSCRVRGKRWPCASTSGGMFVSSARFVSEHKGQAAAGKSSPSPLEGERAGVRGENYSGDPSKELSIHGVEKTDETGRLCRLNLAVHGLEGEIKYGGTVNAVDTAVRVSARRHSEGQPQDLPERQDHERLKDTVGANRRFAFGLPRSVKYNGRAQKQLPIISAFIFVSPLNSSGVPRIL